MPVLGWLPVQRLASILPLLKRSQPPNYGISSVQIHRGMFQCSSMGAPVRTAVRSIKTSQMFPSTATWSHFHSQGSFSFRRSATANVASTRCASFVAAGRGVPRSRLRFPGLATVGLGTRTIKLLGTSLVSTTAVTAIITLSVSRDTSVLCAAGRRSDSDDDKGEDLMKMIDRIAKRALFGGDGTGPADDALKKRNKGNDNDSSTVDLFRDKINEVLGSGFPAQLSFGFVMGVCCGFVAKKTAKVALVVVGLGFGSLQVLSYLGYVQLDYSKVEGEVMDALDIDNNGKVDTDDMKELYDRAMKVAAYNLPTGSGFAAGAIIGLRMG